MSANNRAKSLSSYLRLLTIVDLAEEVGLGPVGSRLIHLVAYLANALSPVWSLAPQRPEVLKLFGGPYDPSLQHDLDQLVGRGALLIHEPRYDFSGENGWRLAAAYSVNDELARPFLDTSALFPDEHEATLVVREICLALSAMPDEAIDALARFDVSYADPSVSPNSVVDLSGPDGANPTSRTARRFADLGRSGHEASPSEQAHLYIRHMARLAGAEASE